MFKCIVCEKVISCECSKKYPTKWRMRRAGGSYPIKNGRCTNYQNPKDDEIVIEWERDIAPFHSQIRFTIIKVDTLEGLIVNRSFWGEELSYAEIDKKELLKHE